MPDFRDAELRDNFEYFQGVVGSLMAVHAGKYALLHDCTLVDVYARPAEALQAGHAQFSDGRFSIQKVIDRPLDLGFMSYGSGDRTTD